jgi:hypothetical protein
MHFGFAMIRKLDPYILNKDQTEAREWDFRNQTWWMLKILKKKKNLGKLVQKPYHAVHSQSKTSPF